MMHSTENASPRAANSETVLLVENDEGIRKLLGRILKLNGYKFKACSSALKALEHEESFDLLLTDVKMLGMNGIELAKHLRKKNPTLGVVIISGNPQVAPPKGIFLPKPFTVNELLVAIEKAMDLIKNV